MCTATMNRQAIDVAADDSQLQQRVRLALWASGYPTVWNVAITVHEGLVTLKGRVGCYYEKQIAQTAVMRVDGVETLRNEIAVET